MKKSFFCKKNKQKTFSEKGFSLIELVIVIAVMTIFLSFSFFDYNSFGSGVRLENVTYKIALAIREAQTFGINTKVEASDNESSIGYGMYFESSSYGSSVLDNPEEDMILFFDLNQNSVFSQNSNTGNCQTNSSDECFNYFSLGNENVISKLEIFNSGGTAVEVDYLNILFLRPNPDATISSSYSGGNSGARITVTSNDDQIRCVEVGLTGNISIRKTCT